MTCHHGFVKKKSLAVKLRQRKTRRQTVQTSSKKIGKTNTYERRGHDPTMAFPEFAIPADCRVVPRRSTGSRHPAQQ
jgi:hypothetical protein